MGHYADSTTELRQELARTIPRDALRQLHQRRPVLHFLISAALVLTLGASLAGAALLEPWFLWIPCAIIAGFAIFNFTVLLHDAVHRTVFDHNTDRANRVVALAYALPSGISASQFTRWHLDHHAELGSSEDDPKRHWLSPRRNARWLKALYFTPALFFIYFRAARRETSSYEPELQRTIARERNLTILTHLLIGAAVFAAFGWEIGLRAWVVPYFFVFPVAFALNRLGQHYDIDPEDPHKWATLVPGSRFWDVVFLCSNYHLEHHYFPGVPLYNLPRLQKLLMPFYEKHGMKGRGYGSLLWSWLVLNQPPHQKWSGSGHHAAAPQLAK